MWVDVVGGNVQMVVGSVQGILPHIQRSVIRAIAATGKARSPKLPEVPAFIEQGFSHPVFALDGYLPMCAPAGTPRDTLYKLVEGVREAYNTPRIKDLHSFYGIPNAPVVSLADVRRIWDSDSVQWISLSEKLGRHAGVGAPGGQPAAERRSLPRLDHRLGCAGRQRQRACGWRGGLTVISIFVDSPATPW